MVTIALASLLIGGAFLGTRQHPATRRRAWCWARSYFRLVYTIALRLDMPAFMLKLVSSVIVIAGHRRYRISRRSCPCCAAGMCCAKDGARRAMLKIANISKTFNPGTVG